MGTCTPPPPCNSHSDLGDYPFLAPAHHEIFSVSTWASSYGTKCGGTKYVNPKTKPAIGPWRTCLSLNLALALALASPKLECKMNLERWMISDTTWAFMPCFCDVGVGGREGGRELGPQVCMCLNCTPKSFQGRDRWRGAAPI